MLGMLILKQATQEKVKADVASILLNQSPEMAKVLLHLPGAGPLWQGLCLGQGHSGESLHLGLGEGRLCIFLVL